MSLCVLANEIKTWNALKRSVAFLIHLQYNRTTLEKDVALITLNETLEFTNSIQPICLTVVQPEVNGEKTYVMGWGDTRRTDYYTYLQVVIA